ncbi:3-hydroxy-3-methylglutaryl-CoA reductase, partial [Staphylococcus pasteuri]
MKSYGWLNDDDYNTLKNYATINEDVANSLIENVITQGALPVGLLPQIDVEGQSYVVPMMVEEPSVVAAASYGAKLVN